LALYYSLSYLYNEKNKASYVSKDEQPFCFKLTQKLDVFSQFIDKSKEVAESKIAHITTSFFRFSNESFGNLNNINSLFYNRTKTLFKSLIFYNPFFNKDVSFFFLF
jgi:hypothetical protein